MPPLLMSDSEDDADSLWMTAMTASAGVSVLMLAVALGTMPSSFMAASARWALLDFDRSRFSSFCGWCTMKEEGGNKNKCTNLFRLLFFLLNWASRSARVGVVTETFEFTSAATFSSLYVALSERRIGNGMALHLFTFLLFRLQKSLGQSVWFVGSQHVIAYLLCLALLKRQPSLIDTWVCRRTSAFSFLSFSRVSRS